MTASLMGYNEGLLANLATQNLHTADTEDGSGERDLLAVGYVIHLADHDDVNLLGTRWRVPRTIGFSSQRMLPQTWVGNAPPVPLPAFRKGPVKHTNVSQFLGSRLLAELLRLRDGWAGEDSVKPKAAAIRDIFTTTLWMPANTSLPETEVDPDDGSVVLRWVGADALSFSLTFLGRGEVTGFLSTAPAWKLKVSDSVNLTIMFCNSQIQSVMAG